MKDIFTRGDFHSYRQSGATLNEETIRTRFFSETKKPENQTTVFLSHKHDDLDDLSDIIAFLEQKYNVKVYLDCMDSGMPKNTCGDTAARIKKAISETDRFILMATDDAIESKWCNWELGYGDAKKFRNHIAILPLQDKNESVLYGYKGNEYMQIYPHIVEYGNNEKDSNGNRIKPGFYWVCQKDTGEKIICPLEKWLDKHHLQYLLEKELIAIRDCIDEYLITGNIEDL